MSEGILSSDNSNLFCFPLKVWVIGVNCTLRTSELQIANTGFSNDWQIHYLLWQWSDRVTHQHMHPCEYWPRTTEKEATWFEHCKETTSKVIQEKGILKSQVKHHTLTRIFIVQLWVQFITNSLRFFHSFVSFDFSSPQAYSATMTPLPLTQSV